MSGGVTRRSGKQRVQEQAATHVDGGADDEEQDRRHERELDESLTGAAVHHDVVVLLDPESVTSPPRRLRSLNP